MAWKFPSPSRPGDVLADFVLPDSRGRLRRLRDLQAEGPAVLSFNRGSWRPYCEKEIGAWAEHQAALTGAGARLIIVTPETGGRMMALSQPAGDAAVVLCDVNLGVALRYELAFPVGPRARTHPPPAPGGGPPQQPAR